MPPHQPLSRLPCRSHTANNFCENSHQYTKRQDCVFPGEKITYLFYLILPPALSKLDPWHIDQPKHQSSSNCMKRFKGFIKRAGTNTKVLNVHYYPSSPNPQGDSATTPIQILYNCSCKQPHPSLMITSMQALHSLQIFALHTSPLQITYNCTLSRH